MNALAELQELLVTRGLRVKAHLGPPPGRAVTALLVANPAIPSVGETVRLRADGLVDSSGTGLGDIFEAADKLAGRLRTPETIAWWLAGLLDG
ncbi:hypothetical protein AB0J52_10950 [Spirillospora sp. NPDC049652]